MDLELVWSTMSPLLQAPQRSAPYTWQRGQRCNSLILNNLYPGTDSKSKIWRIPCCSTTFFCRFLERHEKSLFFPRTWGDLKVVGHDVAWWASGTLCLWGLASGASIQLKHIDIGIHFPKPANTKIPNPSRPARLHLFAQTESCLHETFEKRNAWRKILIFCTSHPSVEVYPGSGCQYFATQNWGNSFQQKKGTGPALTQWAHGPRRLAAEGHWLPLHGWSGNPWYIEETTRHVTEETECNRHITKIHKTHSEGQNCLSEKMRKDLFWRHAETSFANGEWIQMTFCFVHNRFLFDPSKPIFCPRRFSRFQSLSPSAFGRRRPGHWRIGRRWCGANQCHQWRKGGEEGSGGIGELWELVVNALFFGIDGIVWNRLRSESPGFVCPVASAKSSFEHRSQPCLTFFDVFLPCFSRMLQMISKVHPWQIRLRVH